MPAAKSVDGGAAGVWHLRCGALNLASLLPAFLPEAITWAEREERRALATGDPLPPSGLELARRVGVRSPEKIRVSVVDALPMPDSPMLREAAIQSGLLGPGMIGLTLGYAIFVKAGHPDTRVLSHECRHVQQYESHGGIAAFLPVYLAQVVSAGYGSAPFEIDARDHEIDVLGPEFPFLPNENAETR